MPLASQCLILAPSFFFAHKKQCDCSSRRLRTGLFYGTPACDDLPESLTSRSTVLRLLCVTGMSSNLQLLLKRPLLPDTDTAWGQLYFGKVLPHRIQMFSLSLWTAVLHLCFAALYWQMPPCWFGQFCVFCCSFTASGWQFEATLSFSLLYWAEDAVCLYFYSCVVLWQLQRGSCFMWGTKVEKHGYVKCHLI